MARSILSAILLLIAIDAGAQQVDLGNGITFDAPKSWNARPDVKTTWLLERRVAGKIVATMIVRVEQRRNHEEAVRRLAEIEAEFPATPTYRTIAGWPALERKVRAPFRTPDPQEDSPDVRRTIVGPSGKITAWRATTAVAAGNLLVRLHTLVQPDADPKLADEALQIGRSLKLPRGSRSAAKSDVRRLTEGRNRPRPTTPRTHAKSTADREGASGGSKAVMVNGSGETEAAISSNGKNILTVAGCWMSYSSNGGASFSTNVKTGSGAPSGLDGDCSVAWGPSGNFYSTQLGNMFVAFYSSSNPTSSFPYVTLAVDRRSSNTNTDQPHVLADRWNPSTSGNGDRVYVVWQETPQFVARIACSSDSGATWSAPVDTNSGDVGYPKAAVGPDGMVYVVSRAGANVVIDKYSSCDDGLVEQSGFPVNITISDVTCPVPGVDRCNNGNTLSSPTIAVDDLNASTVYLGYANTNGSGTGQDIIVMQSTDGGLTFPNSVAVNSSVPAVRYMPWLGAYNGVVYAGWYDRRDATTSSNDLTSYYRGSASVVNGTLTPGPEVDLSGGYDDAQCASGWSCGVRDPDDSGSCSTQPQNAGYCGQSGSSTRCDFASPQCSSGQQCVTSMGCPKYGDYNGMAVAGGNLVNVWASATSPQGGNPPGYIAAWTVVSPVP